MLVGSPKTRILKAIMKSLACGRNAMLQSFFPEVADLASVKEKDIRAVLPAPMKCRSTSRQRSSLKFDYDKSRSILMHRHAFAFFFSAHFFVICCCSKLFGCFLYFLEIASTNYTGIFCNFAYFNYFFSLSDSALCLIRLCPIGLHWAQLDRKIIFLNVLVNFFVSLNL